MIINNFKISRQIIHESNKTLDRSILKIQLIKPINYRWEFKKKKKKKKKKTLAAEGMREDDLVLVLQIRIMCNI
jgi:hypothetical protein